MTLPKDLIKQIENADFTIDVADNGISFGKFSSAGQDFCFFIGVFETLRDFCDEIYNCYSNFDVSEETYLWLDESGHGKNGAPWDMKEVYEDMEECKGFINDLYYIINEYINNH